MEWEGGTRRGASTCRRVQRRRDGRKARCVGGGCSTTAGAVGDAQRVRYPRCRTLALLLCLALLTARTPLSTTEGYIYLQFFSHKAACGAIENGAGPNHSQSTSLPTAREKRPSTSTWAVRRKCADYNSTVVGHNIVRYNLLFTVRSISMPCHHLQCMILFSTYCT